jgi:uncharacterized membrane protein YsdA (DUF1294 family)
LWGLHKPEAPAEDILSTASAAGDIIMGRRPSWIRRPERLHGALALLIAWTLTLTLLVPFRHSFGWYHVLAAWLLAINLTAFGYYRFDKGQARKGGRRVPEIVLHGQSLAGGSVGAGLAMRLFRHKTAKGRFRLAFWLIVAFQVLLLAWVARLVWEHHARPQNRSSPAENAASAGPGASVAASFAWQKRLGG